MILRTALALFAAIWLAGCGEAAEETPPPSPALWEIKGPDGQKGFLFGTIHVLPDGVDWQTEAISKALTESDTIAVEIANFDVSEAFMTRAKTPGQPTITARLDPKQRPAALQLLDHAGYRPGDFTDVESWAASIMLANAISNGSSENGVDRALIQRAQSDDKLTVIELEGAARQLDLFDALPADAQRTMLSSVVNEFATPQDEARERRDAWITGDMARLERELTSGMMKAPAVYEAILKGRNIAMRDKTAALLAKGKRVFVAVGAGHMVGEDGLPTLLEQAGYTVTRIQ